MKIDFSEISSGGGIASLIGSVVMFIGSRTIPYLIKNPAILGRVYARLFYKENRMLHYIRSIQALYKPDFHGVLDRNFSEDCIVVFDAGSDKRLTNSRNFIDFSKFENTFAEIREKGFIKQKLASENEEMKMAFYGGNKKFFIVSVYAFAIYRNDFTLKKNQENKVRSVYVMAFENEVILTDNEIEEISRKLNTYMYAFKM